MDNQMNELKENKTKCKGIDYKGDGCRQNVKDELFCKNHRYMESYTEIMMQNLKRCGGCRKMYYLENGNQMLKIANITTITIL
jgi:hypothetical protein